MQVYEYVPVPDTFVYPTILHDPPFCFTIKQRDVPLQGTEELYDFTSMFSVVIPEISDIHVDPVSSQVMVAGKLFTISLCSIGVDEFGCAPEKRERKRRT